MKLLLKLLEFHLYGKFLLSVPELMVLIRNHEGFEDLADLEGIFELKIANRQVGQRSILVLVHGDTLEKELILSKWDIVLCGTVEEQVIQGLVLAQCIGEVLSHLFHKTSVTQNESLDRA